jgi:transcriptional regulator with XRE-family HTH domain
MSGGTLQNSIVIGKSRSKSASISLVVAMQLLVLTFNSTRGNICGTMAGANLLGERIRQRRKHKRLSQREFASRVAARLKEQDGRGFDFSYLSKIENGHLVPSVAALVAIAEELDDNPDELLAVAEKAPRDLGQKLRDSPNARLFYRSAVDLNLSEADWRKLLDDLKARKAQK